MLVLSRKCGEAIIISDNITVTIVEVHGQRVKLGVSAPNEAPVHRAEVHARIMNNRSTDVMPRRSWSDIQNRSLSGVR